MKTMNFNEFDRELLDDMFGLKIVRKNEVLIDWIEKSKLQKIQEFEQFFLLQLQNTLIDRVDSWNEQELIENFIGPVFSLVNFNTLEYGLFSERLICAIVKDIELSGKPDAIVAKGFYSPRIPYFCFHEYKKENEPKGDPAGQCLVAMLVAQELNNNLRPIYGVVVKGLMWNFIVLQGKEYAISNSYKATDEELYEIIKLLKHLKTIIEVFVKM
jgi:hypothetical protein